MTAEWIIAGIAIVTAIVGVPVWAFLTFQTKVEAKQSCEELAEKHEALYAWMTRQDATLNRVAQDVSYLRGRMETNKGLPSDS